MDTESRYLRDIRDAIKGIAKRSGMDVSGNAKTKYLKEIADAIRENGGGGHDGNDKVKQEMIDTGSDDPIVFSESLSTNTGFVGKSSHFTYSPGSKTVKLTDGPAIPNKEAKITPESETFLNKIKTDVDESTYDETRYSAKVSTASNGYGIQFIKSESTTSNPAGGPGPVTVEKTRAYTEIRHNNVAITNIDNDPNTGFNRTMTLKDDDIVMGGETPNTWDGTNTSLKSALAACGGNGLFILTATPAQGTYDLTYGEYEVDTSFSDAVAAINAGKMLWLKVVDPGDDSCRLFPLIEYMIDNPLSGQNYLYFKGENAFYDPQTPSAGVSLCIQMPKFGLRGDDVLENMTSEWMLSNLTVTDTTPVNQ